MFFNKYTGGGTYNKHTDAPFMHETRTDLACTMFLTDPDSYEGGELCIEQPNGAIIKHKGKKGDCIIYDCGAPHWVTPVTKGERICGIAWIQSNVRDPRKREVLHDMYTMCNEMEPLVDYKDEECKYRKWFVYLGKTHGNLMRFWVE